MLWSTINRVPSSWFIVNAPFIRTKIRIFFFFFSSRGTKAHTERHRLLLQWPLKSTLCMFLSFSLVFIYASIMYGDLFFVQCLEDWRLPISVSSRFQWNGFWVFFFWSKKMRSVSGFSQRGSHGFTRCKVKELKLLVFTEASI